MLRLNKKKKETSETETTTSLSARLLGRGGESSGSGSRDLFGQTLRTVVILVGSCVLFVGALSAAAVAITSKAMGASPSTVELRDTNSPAPKKPLSI